VRRKRLESPAELDDSVPSPDRDPDGIVDLTGALHGLPPRQQRAIVLREWQGLEYAEIADRLGLTHAAVETLLHRARRSLRAAA
jgi:RNA polymerase sigma-70 factor (ECF subfamily)